MVGKCIIGVSAYEGESRKMTVLVVEDDKLISEGLTISLEQEGYRVQD